MSRLFSLAYLTYAPLPAPEAIRLAAELGAQAVGVRILPAAPGGAFDPLMQDAALLRETKAALRDTGIAVFDVEIIRIGAGFHAPDHARFVEICGELGAKAVLVADDDPDEQRFIANYAGFCDLAAPYGLTADLEFMPWTAVKTARHALQLVTAADRPNGGILVDGIHFGRSATTTDDLRAIPPHLLHYAQLCDASPGLDFTEAELIHTARAERFLPGEGGIDLVGMLAALPQDLPLSVEIPNEAGKAELGVAEWCRRSLAASRAMG